MNKTMAVRRSGEQPFARTRKQDASVEVGKMNGAWREMKLGEIACPVKEIAQPQGNSSNPYIGLEHISQGTFELTDIGRESDVTSTKFRFCGGQILYGKLRPYFKKVFRPSFSGVCSTDIWVLDTKDPKTLTQGYLYALMRTDWFTDRATASSKGTKMPRADWDVVAKLDVNFPPLPVQHRIAEILGALDDKMECNRRINVTLEAMAMALYKHWFVKPLSLEMQLLTDFIEIYPLISIPKGKEVPYVDMKALPTNSMSVADVSRRPFTAGSKFQNADTLFARITPCLENGKTAFVDFLKDGEAGFGSTEFIILRAKQGISPQFVYCCARDEALRAHAIQSMVGSSGRQRVRTDCFNKFEMKRVDRKLMQSFHARTEKWFKKIRANTVENKILTSLRDYLLPKLLSGEIRLHKGKNFF